MADPHSGPVPDSARAADRAARERGRVEVFNATRPGGLDGWTMELTQYELMRAHILAMVDEADGDGVLLKDVIRAAQDRYGTHEAFPTGRLTNYCTYTKVDLEARGLIERIPRSSPQRLRPTPVTRSAADASSAQPSDGRRRSPRRHP